MKKSHGLSRIPFTPTVEVVGPTHGCPKKLSKSTDGLRDIRELGHRLFMVLACLIRVVYTGGHLPCIC